MKNQDQDESGALPQNPEGLDSPLNANHLDFLEIERRPRAPFKKTFAKVLLVAVIIVFGAFCVIVYTQGREFFH